MPFPGKVVRAGHAGSHGEGAQEDPDVGQMRRGRPPDRVARLEHFEKDVDEGAALEIVALEPLVKHVENREQAVAGGRCTALYLRLEPLAGPQLLAPLKEGQHQFILGDEVSGLRQFTEQLLERMAAAVKAERATLSRVDGEWVVIEGSFDSNGPPAQAGGRWRITAPDFQRLVTQQEPMVRTFDPAMLPAPFREQLAGVKHTVTVPLVVEGKGFATVAVSRRQDRPLEPRDMETPRELGSIAVLALRHAMLLAQARVATIELRTR